MPERGTSAESKQHSHSRGWLFSSGLFVFSGAGREGSPLTMSQRDGWLVNGSA